jgi:hypothetical protein
MKHRQLVPAALLGIALTLAGCGGGSDDSTDASKPSAKADTTTAPGGDFCADLKSNRATGASFGPMEIWQPKADLIEQADSGLAAMGDATPPQEIAAEWEVRKDYLTDFKAAAEKLPDGGKFSGGSVAGDESTTAASKKITDYWFDTCAS